MNKLSILKSKQLFKPTKLMSKLTQNQNKNQQPTGQNQQTTKLINNNQNYQLHQKSSIYVPAMA